MNFFPSSSLSTTFVSTRFVFGKRRDSFAGLGFCTCSTTGAAAGPHAGHQTATAAINNDVRIHRIVAPVATADPPLLLAGVVAGPGTHGDAGDVHIHLNLAVAAVLGGVCGG